MPELRTTAEGAARAAATARLNRTDAEPDDLRVAFAAAVRDVLRGAAAGIARERGVVPTFPFDPKLAALGRGRQAADLGLLRESLLGFEARRAPPDGVVLFGAGPAAAVQRARFAALLPAEQAALRDLGVSGEIPAGAVYLHPVAVGRKTAGAFYTSHPLAAPTVARTLAPLSRARPLRILDPAMGCGAFLIAALRCQVERTGRPPGRVLRDEIAGVDVDPLAVEAARLTLWLEAADPTLALADLEPSLRVADGLFDDALAEGSFAAVVGNPPWEIVKPNSREFFAGFDPLFRRLGKAEAARRRRTLAASDAGVEAAWDAHVAWHRDFARRVRQDPRYRLQGPGDANTYKLFLERGLHLLEEGGRLGLIVPSGIQTDLGAAPLRRHLLDACTWEWLFLFENRDGLFDIHRSYRFGPLIAQKGGKTKAVRIACGRRDIEEWARPEPAGIRYRRAAIDALSPATAALPEVPNAGELRLLERIHAGADRVEDLAGKVLRYRREFDLTNDVALFHETAALARDGFRPDRHGRQVDARGRVVALPLLQGVMVQSFTFPAAVYQGGGRGSRSDWSEADGVARPLRARFHVRLDDVRRRAPGELLPRLAFRDVQNATNERTFLGTIVPGFPCGNTLPSLTTGGLDGDLRLLAVLTSLVVDRVLRRKMSQNHVNWFHVRELPLPRDLFGVAGDVLVAPAAALALAAPGLAGAARTLRSRLPPGWRRARGPAERLRWRCVLDAVVAHRFGLTADDVCRLVGDCAHPVAELRRSGFRRSLDPKGFWRVDRTLPPARRHPVLAQRAFLDLQERLARAGAADAEAVLRAFCAGAGAWQLPGGFPEPSQHSGRTCGLPP